MCRARETSSAYLLCARSVCAAKTQCLSRLSKTQCYVFVRPEAVECIDGNNFLAKKDNVAYNVARILFSVVVCWDQTADNVDGKFASGADFLRQQVKRKNSKEVLELAHRQASAVNKPLCRLG